MLVDEAPEDVALDFDLTIEAVLIAAKFEQQLTEGLGLAA